MYPSQGGHYLPFLHHGKDLVVFLTVPLDVSMLPKLVTSKALIQSRDFRAWTLKTMIPNVDRLPNLIRCLSSGLKVPIVIAVTHCA